MNAQLQTKIDEVERASDDLSNLLTSTNIATVFLDPQLRIRRFTPAATRLFTLIPSDVGRPLADIAQKFADPKLLDDAQAVLQHLAPRQLEVQAEGGRRYFRQVLPYRTQDSRINGVVLTFSDVAADALYAARSELEGRSQVCRRFSTMPPMRSSRSTSRARCSRSTGAPSACLGTRPRR